MTDKIEISEEQFYDWFHKPGTVHNFDSLKAFISKPKRRKFWMNVYAKDPDVSVYDTPEKANRYAAPHRSECIEVEEVLPDDLPRMTKAEAREWLENAWENIRYENGYHWKDLEWHGIFLKALGLSEDG